MTATGIFLSSFIAGAVVFWQVSKYLERFRRARSDFRRLRSGLRTLVVMMFRRGFEALLWLAVGLTVVAVVIFVVAKNS